MHVLAVGAHPDDVEIGAGALIAKLALSGHTVSVLVLTDEGQSAALRRSEAVRGASSLGVPAARVHFAGFADGGLRVELASVGVLRAWAEANGIRPDLVLVHTESDSHNDHVEANRLLRATFRHTAFLFYSIHLSLEAGAFSPRVFVDVSVPLAERKRRALAQHRSQESRIGRCDLARSEADLGTVASLPRAEAFEVMVQRGARTPLPDILELGDSAFHRFWAPLVRSAGVELLYESFESPGATVDWPTPHEGRGRDALREAFGARWLPRSPLIESPSSDGAAALLGDRTVILSGHGLSNRVVAEVYNGLPGVRFRFAYDLPRRNPPYLVDQWSGQPYEMPPVSSGAAPLAPVTLLVAKVPNPLSEGTPLLAVAGSSGLGTGAGLRFLSDPASLPELADALAAASHVEAVLTVDPATATLALLELHQPAAPAWSVPTRNALRAPRNRG